MAHDAKGTPLQIGDRVLIPGILTGIAPTDEYCNCAVDLEHFMPPDKTTTTLLNINTRQLIKAEPAEAPASKINRPVPTAPKTERVKVNGD